MAKKMNALNPDAIRQIEETIHYTFQNQSLLRQAFTRGSYVNEARQRGNSEIQSNEVLEFCGDAVLSVAIISRLMEKYATKGRYGLETELDEGDFSRIKSNLSNKKMLSARMEELGLHRFLIANNGDEKSDAVKEASVKEDLFESIIGAVYFDCGKKIDIVTDVVSAMLDIQHYFSTVAKKDAISNKNAINEFCDSRGLQRFPYPDYRILSKEGSEHDPVYRIGCYIGETLYGEGTAKNKKLAENIAAGIALAALRARFPLASRAETTIQWNAKSELNIFAQKKQIAPPVYILLEEKFENSLHYFTVRCDFMGNSTQACACSKKESEKSAAEEMLKIIGQRAE